MLFKTLHSFNNRADPNNVFLYKHAILLHKSNNNESMSFDWLFLFFNQISNGRQRQLNFLIKANLRLEKIYYRTVLLCLTDKLIMTC